MTLPASGVAPRVSAHSPPLLPGAAPLLGHLREFTANRTAMQVRVARSHPHAARLRVGVFRIALVNSPVIAQEVLQNQADAFVKSAGLSIFLRPILGDGLLTSAGDVHTRQRRLIAPALTPKRIAGYAATMAERAARMVAAWKEGEELDAAEAMMRLTLEIVGKTLFDAEIGGDAGAVGEALTAVMTNTIATLGSPIPFPPIVPTPRNRATRRACAELDAIIYRLIAERRRDPASIAERTDLLSSLLAARDEDGGRMDDEQVRDEAMTLFLAGHETTAVALAWAIHLLSRNPAARARAEEETAPLRGRSKPLAIEDLKALPYTLAVLKETMRLYPPAFIVGRRALREVLVPGPAGETYRLRRNGTVLVNVLGIHRRPDLYANPDAFEPERFLGDREKELPRCVYMPFGAGPRICVGNHFALMEAHLILATILASVRLDHLPGKEEVEMEPLVTLRPRGGVHVRVTRR